ncbi:MAG: YqaA family protein [Verrucomicrobiae bacterium]|nr:YqaA family protein [Verrucomicrobiae bacterium]
MINSQPSESRVGLLRRLYDWTIHWANTPQAIPALFVIAFIESSFFPIPPDVLLLAICFASPKKWLRNALVCTVGSCLGGLFGWWIGWGLYEVVGKPIVAFYRGEEVMQRVSELYAEHGAWAILIAAITPIPYKVFTIASGVFGYSPWLLFVFSLMGRGFRFFAVALLIRFFGERIRAFLEKNFEWASIAFVVLGILGFVAIKFLR